MNPTRLLLDVPSASATVTGAAPQPPNLVFILTADQGWSDLGCIGSDLSEDSRTPMNIKKAGGLIQFFRNCS